MKPSEDLSLVDILAVLLKFRYLIVIGTVACSLLAGVCFFIIPKITCQVESVPEQKNVCAIYIITAHRNPEDGASMRWYDFDFSKVLTDAFSNQSQLAEEYKAFPFLGTPYEADNVREYNNFIHKLVSDKVVRINTRADWSREYRNTFNLSVSLQEENLTLLDGFIRDYITKVSDSLSDSLCLPSSYSFFTVSETPFVYDVLEQSSSGMSKKKFVLVVMLIFILFVILAFSIDAVQSLKKDESAVAVLKEAFSSPFNARKQNEA